MASSNADFQRILHCALHGNYENIIGYKRGDPLWLFYSISKVFLDGFNYSLFNSDTCFLYKNKLNNHKHSRGIFNYARV